MCPFNQNSKKAVWQWTSKDIRPLNKQITEYSYAYMYIYMYASNSCAFTKFPIFKVIYYDDQITAI